MDSSKYPQCNVCHKTFAPGATWKSANFCRAAYLLEYIAEHPGLTAWELHLQTNIGYRYVGKGLMKARDYNTLTWVEEEREQGGVRYRYSVTPQWAAVVADWYAHGKLGEDTGGDQTVLNRLGHNGNTPV